MKNAKELIEFIKHFVNIDITNHIEPRFSNRNRLHLYTTDLNNNELNAIKRAMYFKKLDFAIGGADALTLFIKRKVTN